MDKTEPENKNNTWSKRYNSQQIEIAIRDAQNLVIYTARAGILVEEEILNTLIIAKTKGDPAEWSPEFTIEFWEAFRQINLLIKPATVASVNAICIEPSKSGFRGFVQRQYGLSQASQTITRYTLWTLGVLIIVLFFQIYWVIGNRLTLTLTELLESQNLLSTALHEVTQDHSELEVLYKITAERGDNQEGIGDEISDSPVWQRETLQPKTEQVKLEKELEVLRTQLERNSAILDQWSTVWEWMFNLDKLIPDNEEIKAQIDAIQSQLETLEQPAEEGLVNARFTEEQNKLIGMEEERVQLDQILDYLENIAALRLALTGLDSEADGQDNQAQPELSEESGEDQSGNLQGSPASDQTGDARTQLNSEIDKNQAEIDNIFQNLSRIPTDYNQTVEAKDQLVSEIDLLTVWLAKNNYETIENERKDILVKLKAEKVALQQQQNQWKTREKSHRVRLSTNFMLIILQSYILPVLYGLLGASVYALRTLMREISNVTFSSDRSYLLRMALGTLSGLIIGWFIFLLPGQSVVSSISPLALAFLVGYNIEIVFTLMDRLIHTITRTDEDDPDSSQSGEEDKKDEEIEENPQSPLPA